MTSTKPASPLPPPGPDAPRDASRLGTGLAWVVLLILAGLSSARALRGDAVWLLLVWGAYTPFVLLPAYVILGLAVRRGQRLLALGSLALVVAHLVAVVPQVFSRAPSSDALPSPLRVVTANGNGWNQHPDETLRNLSHFDADLVCLQEVSPTWLDALRDEGWLDLYPHQHLDVREGVWGMALLSRLPLRNIDARDLNEAPGIQAEVQHMGRTVHVFCVHPAPPAGDFVASHLDALERILLWAEAHQSDSAVLLGDLNSTPYSDFSSALRAHMDDAWELAGPIGLGHTWPNNGLMYPPARLDHVYVTRSLGVSRVQRALAASSDHAPVIADIVLHAR